MIQTDDSSRLWVGNNSTTVPYPVPFYFPADETLIVVVRDELGAEATQQLGTDYTVLGAKDPNGGSITTTWEVPVTSVVSIVRNVPIVQLHSYEEGDSFPAKSHERALDEGIMIDQQLARGMGTGTGDEADLGTSFRLTSASGGIRALSKINNTLVGLDDNGQSILLTPTETLQHLGVVASTWPDQFARQTAAAIYKGQLGVQLSDLTVWVANSMLPGDWLPNPRANGIVIANNGVTTAKANPEGDIVGTSASQTLANKTLNAPTINNPIGMVPADVGLGNIDDTSDLDKPISEATALALGTKEDKANKGNTSGYAPLDVTRKIPPEFLPGGGTGGTIYRGTWNANTNVPEILDGSAEEENLGWFYTVSVAGTTSVDGESVWGVGDQIYSNSVVWQKIPVAGATVISVAGRIGAVVLYKEDVGLDQVDNTSDLTKNSATGTLTNKTINGANNTINVRLNTSDVSGNLPPARLNNGTGATANTWWCGDNTWKQPQGTGDVNGPFTSTIDSIVVFDGLTGKQIKGWPAGSGFVSTSLLGVPTTQPKIKIGDLDNEDWVNVPEMELVTADDEYLIWDAAEHAFKRVKRSNASAPVGTIIDWAGMDTAVPPGWLLCDGELVAKATYGALYAVIGDRFMPANTDPLMFRIPDCRGAATVMVDNTGGRLNEARTHTGWGNGATVGSNIGWQSHVVSGPEMPYHAHGGYNRHFHNHTDSGNPHVGSGLAYGANYNYHAVVRNTTEVTGVYDYGYQGGNAAHNNVQWSCVVNKLIKF